MVTFSDAAVREVERLEPLFVHTAYRVFHASRGVPDSAATVRSDMIDWFSAPEQVIARAWVLLQDRIDPAPRGATRERFLWSLNYIKVYPSSRGGSSRVGCDIDTYRKLVWYFLEELSYLEGEVIDWNRRFRNDIGNDCLASIDGVDFWYKTRTLASGKPDKRFYSYKFKKSGLRYIVAVCIRSSDIVFVGGPYLPGMMNDLQIFRDHLMHMLPDDERVEADDGYVGECPEHVVVRHAHVTVNPEQGRMRGRLGRRHETINRRLQAFRVLTSVFKQSVNKHSMCLRSAAILIQLAFQCGEQGLFDMREYDNRLTDKDAANIFGV